MYELPFPDAAFDVAYAHQVLQHLRERGAALREMLRVVRPGGLVAVRDVDWGTAAYWPRDPWIEIGIRRIKSIQPWTILLETGKK